MNSKCFFFIFGVFLLGYFETSHCFLDEVEDVISVTQEITKTVSGTWGVVSPLLPKHATENLPPILRKREEKLAEKLKLITQILRGVEKNVNAVSMNAVSILRKDVQTITHYEIRVNNVFQMIGQVEDSYARFQSYLPTSNDNADYSESEIDNINDQIDFVNEELPETNIRLRHKHISLDPGNFTEPSYGYIGDVGEDSTGGRTKFERPLVRDFRKTETMEKPSYEPFTLENFARSTVSHDSASIFSTMSALAEQLVPSRRSGMRFYNKGGFLSFLSEILQEIDSTMCSVNQSRQQLLYNLYIYLHTVQLKGYVMMQFSYMLLRLYGKGNFTTEASMETKKFDRRFEAQLAMARRVIGSADNEMWQCDPHQHVEEETFVQITRLLQGYIQNEVDLNGGESCSENCGYYSVAKQHSCFKNKFCAQQLSCTGRILNCQYIDSDMNVCLSALGNIRRYDWIEYENGQVLGKQGTCRNLRKVDSWWRYLVIHCSYCFCLCDEPSRLSDRYFSLRQSISNVTANKVVTGIRFVKHNRMIHLQIQEGELMPLGTIKQSTVQWKPVPDFKIDDENVKEGVDYHTLKYEERAIDLDSIKLPPNCLLTGVKFRKIGSHLNLEAECSHFNSTNGKLIKPESSMLWVGNDNTDAALDFPRVRLELYNPDIPTRAPSSCSSMESNDDMYVEFTHTGLNADAAQTTVPFIDIQPVAPSPAVPLVGVGLYHKGCLNYGGYIAPKVMTYNFCQHL